MAAGCCCSWRLFLVLPLLLGDRVIEAATSNRTTLSPSSNTGCFCDLVGNACDPNCCCDEDCTAADKEAFTKCLDSGLEEDNKVCVSKYLLFTQNTQYRTTTTGSGLFCIVRDNYASRNFYNDVRIASTREEFSTLRSQTTKTVYDGTDSSFQQSKPSSTVYKAGDPIVLVFGNGAKGYLAIPKPLVSKQCEDNNPAGFFQDVSSECTRSIASGCTTLPYLAAGSYFSGFQVAASPSFFAVSTVNLTRNALQENSSSSMNVTSFNSSLLIDVNLTLPITCRNGLGVSTLCPFVSPPWPTFDSASQTCSNVVMEVSYTIYYNTSTDITKVSVELVMGSQTTALPLLQKFSIKFIKEGSEPFYRSGNPGYIVGKPLVAGTLQLDTLMKKEAIVLSSDPLSWLTVPSSSADGACSASTKRVPVVFGMDTRTGCTISVTLSTSSAACQIIQDTALSALLGSVPTHVAMFGNSDVNKVGDWVKILNTKPSQTPDGGGGTCRNMITSVHIEVIYANFGFLANPQAKVVGVLFQYGEPREIRYQCTGPFCQYGNSAVNQSFEVVSSVSFIDVSKLPDARVKPTPTFEAKAPSDFFYPFLQ
ncbi:tectonic-1 [Nematostella vectensis]|uniref:tectonic-1 n=1 Tax=Nematostella vectensis TaxID=45351 RepID=UPI00207785D6|nr:tectonic-1 [Nematostella vectensis]